MLCPNTQLPSYFHSFSLIRKDRCGLERVCYHVKVEYKEKCSSKEMNAQWVRIKWTGLCRKESMKKTWVTKKNIYIHVDK